MWPFNSIHTTKRSPLLSIMSGMSCISKSYFYCYFCNYWDCYRRNEINNNKYNVCTYVTYTSIYNIYRTCINIYSTRHNRRRSNGITKPTMYYILIRPFSRFILFLKCVWNWKFSVNDIFAISIECIMRKYSGLLTHRWPVGFWIYLKSFFSYYSKQSCVFLCFFF